MLLTKEVKIKIMPAMVKHYNDLGYDCKFCQIIKVKTKDLTTNSMVDVDVECDYCHNIKQIPYRNYLRAKNTCKIKKDCCDDCKQLKIIETVALKHPKNNVEYINIKCNTIKEIDYSDYKRMGIYCIVNIINNKIYIGSANNLHGRKRIHLHNLRANKHHSEHLQNAWNKYGEENFRFEIIEYVENEIDLLLREQYWIDKLDVCNSKIGYNVSPTANSRKGVKVSEETKEKISKAFKGKKLQPRSEETKNKISKANKGRVREDVRGSNNSKAKLTEDDVKSIKRKIIEGMPIKLISEEYHMDLSSVYDIKNGVTWRHVILEETS